MGGVVTWRYVLPSLPEGRDSWSIVFVDSTGCVAVLSDYGDWCYRWVTKHCGFDDFRKFLAQAETDYVARKLGGGRRGDLEVYDGHATAKNIRERICSYRRDGTFSREKARHEWNLVGSDVEDNTIGFHDWYMHTSFDCSYEFAIYRMSESLKHWATVSFPRLQELLRAELASESAPSEGADAHG